MQQTHPLLVDPTREDPFARLFLNLSTGTGTGTYRRLPVKGQSTIEVLGLNLHERRFPEARKVARECAQRIIQDRGRSRHDRDEAGMRYALDVLRLQPFADVWQSMLRQARDAGRRHCHGR